jgi:predicted PurR-regulated permease PerM
MPSLKTTNPFYVRLAMVLVSLIALFYIAILGKEILSPMIFGLLFAILLLPVASFFEKRLKLPRSAASALSVLTLLLSIAIIFYLVGSQISSLADDWPQFKHQINTSLSSLQHWISIKFHVNIHQQMSYVNNAASKLLMEGTGTSVIGATVLSVSSLLLFVVFIIIDTFFLLYYRRLIIRFLIAVFREENSVMVYEIIARVQFIIRKYILGLVLEMAIVAAASCLALWILDVKYAILLGLIIGLFNVVPYIGIITAMMLTALITFATAAAAGKILVVCGTILGIHLLDSNLLLPLIVGSKVRINALITIIAVIVGGSVWGVVGTFLAIPIVAVMKIVFDRIDSLKPWGLLLGDERDEEQPPPLVTEIEQQDPKNPAV